MLISYSVAYLGKKNIKNSYTLLLNNEDKLMATTREERDLGVHFDEALSFDAHIQHSNSVNKANKMIG